MDAVATAARRAGALGSVLSGAGPSMLAVVRPGGGEAVARAMEEALRAAGIAGRALNLPVDVGGARWERLPET
jgi:homoserine kinase